MKVANWNLERGGRSAHRWERQAVAIAGFGADLVVLTEPPPQVLNLESDVVFAPPLRQGGNGPETWVAILGPVVTAVNIDVPFERMAVAASTRIDGIEVVVYGSVLPWNAAPTQAPMRALAGESSEMMFARMLAEQEADVRALQSAFPPALIIWAGNFNQSFTGPNFGGNNRKRSLLVSSLERLEMSAWNANAPHAKEGMCAIDLICGPADLEVTVERVSTVRDHVVLSDHAGYVANVQLPA